MTSIKNTVRGLDRSIRAKRLYGPWCVSGVWIPQIRLPRALHAVCNATLAPFFRLVLAICCLRFLTRKSGLVPAVNHAPAGAELGMIGALNEIRVEGEWVQISPYGEFDNVAGLQVVDRQAAEDMARELRTLAAKMANHFRGAPIYVGHPDAEGDDQEVDPRYGKMKVGRILELDARNDGLWGRVKFNKAGQEIIDNGFFDYFSPYWGMRAVAARNSAFRPAVLWSVGFTNNPNIPGLPVGKNTKGKTDMPEWLIKLLASAGLLKKAANEAKPTEDEVKAAVNDLLELPGKVTKLEGDLKAANSDKARLDGELTAAKNEKKAADGTAATAEEKFKNERKAHIDTHLTQAVNDGRIKAADRPEWAGKLAADFDAGVKELQGKKPAVNTKSRSAALGSRKNEAIVPDNCVAAINTAAAKYAKDNGLDPAKDRVLIFRALRAEQPKLFEEEKEDAAA